MGKPFTYEDFTDAQLETLKGEKGEPGYTPQKGIDYFDGEHGKDFTFNDFTPEQLESLRGPQGIQGPQGETGPVGPEGPKGEQGDPASIKVNGTTYTRDESGLITLPDYPDAVTWDNIQGKPLFDYKSDIVIDSSNVIKTVYGGYKVIFEYNGNPGSIVGNTIDMSLPTLAWGNYNRYDEYGYNTDPDKIEACYKC